MRADAPAAQTDCLIAENKVRHKRLPPSFDAVKHGLGLSSKFATCIGLNRLVGGAFVRRALAHPCAIECLRPPDLKFSSELWHRQLEEGRGWPGAPRCARPGHDGLFSVPANDEIETGKR